MKGYIYKITNTKNGKSYIGQTTQTPEERFKKHLYSSNNSNCEGYHSKFYNAVRKYGWNNFTKETIFEVERETKEEVKSTLNNLERYFINFYDTFKHGYNSSIGGEGSIGRLATNKTKRKMSESHRKLFLDRPELKTILTTSRVKLISCVETGEIKTSLDFSRDLKVHRRTITNACNLGHTVRGFHFKYVK